MPPLQSFLHEIHVVSLLMVTFKPNTNLRCFIIALALLAVLPVAAQETETVIVAFTQEMALRDLAQEYLGNPNEWEALLHYNGFETLAELRPGIELTIPVGLFQRTMQTLRQAADTARRANMEGAGILAARYINDANDAYDRAIEFKNQGRLEEAEGVAREALELAQHALEEATSKKVQAVSAVLERKEGTVESRTPDEPVWSDTPLNDELIEQERVRTLARSLAGIMFIDSSTISLDENSLAVIGTMKENQIKRSFEAEVTVLEGDVLAHLSALGGKKDITINTPGIETTVRSRKFRTTRDDDRVTRIANYDGEIDVAANQRMVTLRRNEGTKIEEGKQPEDPRKLLQPPDMLSPVESPTLFTADVDFAWEARELAVAYFLEISTDWEFLNVVHRVRVSGTAYQWQAPRKGVYYYRIYAIDSDEFAGPYSEPLGLYIDLDTQPPFLSVKAPQDGALLLSPELEIAGTVEQSAALTINAAPIEYGADGAFAHAMTLTPGDHILEIMATDAAGNVTTIQRRVAYKTAAQLIKLETPSDLVVKTRQVAIRGTLRPQTQVRIDGKPVELPEQFEHVLTLPEGDHAVTLTGVSPEGDEQTLTLRIAVDLTAPQLTLNTIPRATREAELTIAGTVSEPVALLVDGVRQLDAAGDFNLPLVLQEGDNRFTLDAVDPAGNSVSAAIRTVLDTTPPTITEIACAPEEVSGGDIVTCAIRAEDAGVGPAKTGSITLAVTPGDQRIDGILTWNRGTGAFEGSLFIPADVAGEVGIHAISIQDRLKNETGAF